MYKGRDGISCVIMSCKELAVKEKSAIKQCVALLNKAPRLAVIVVGDNMASQSYVRGKGVIAKSVELNVKFCILMKRLRQVIFAILFSV